MDGDINPKVNIYAQQFFLNIHNYESIFQIAVHSWDETNWNDSTCFVAEKAPQNNQEPGPPR